MKINEYIDKLLKEYITNDVISLKNYFSMTKEQKMDYLPHEYYYFFNDFLIEEDIDFERPKDTSTIDVDDEPIEEEYDDLELIYWVEKNNKQLFNDFGEYLYNKISDNELPIPEEEYPAWAYFDDNPTILKNQWLIHFTNDADGISKEGFKYGVDDMTKLGLTTRLGEFEKKYGGYNFAYTINDFPKYYQRCYTKGGGCKYGNEAVVFNASGIKLWHHGDGEPQVIFYGNTARNIIPITSGENNDYAIYSKDGKLLYENDDIIKVVNWLIKNYRQYSKQIH